MIMFKKFGHHQPLDRQAKPYAREGAIESVGPSNSHSLRDVAVIDRPTDLLPLPAVSNPAVGLAERSKAVEIGSHGSGVGAGVDN